MEALRETMKVMMALDYLHERAQERKREQALTGVIQNTGSKVVQLGRQVLGRSLMYLGQRLFGMGKRLLEEAR